MPLVAEAFLPVLNICANYQLTELTNSNKHVKCLSVPRKEPFESYFTTFSYKFMNIKPNI